MKIASFAIFERNWLFICFLQMFVSESGVAPQDAGDGGVVGVAEEVKVVEQGVEVVEVAALGITGGQGAGFLVGIIEFAREAAEELGLGDVDFAEADAHGRVDEDGLASGACHDVAAPEVAVEQGREVGFDEAIFQMCE